MSDYSYFCSNTFGLYRCANWDYGSSVPVWEHVGQTMAISEFSLDLNTPDELQACRSGDSIYLRRPTHYGHDNWVEVYTLAQAIAQFAGSGEPDFKDFRWVELNSATGKEGHLYTMGVTEYNSARGRIYCLKSIDYGANWTRARIAGNPCRSSGGIWAGRVTGNVMYATYNYGLSSIAWVGYSTNEGASWSDKDDLDVSVWVGRAMIDPSAEAISFTGKDINGPNLAKATTVAGAYTKVKDDAGIAINYGYGGGWISAQNGNYVRTIRESILYYSDESGAADTWNSNGVTNVGDGASFERAMWGHDKKPWQVGIASPVGISAPSANYHLLKSTQDNGGTWYDKGGANVSTADTGGGDSIPYNCGGVAENGVYLIIPGRVFTSVVAMQALPTAGTVYADGVQMGTLATGGTVYAHGVEQESPRQT